MGLKWDFVHTSLITAGCPEVRWGASVTNLALLAAVGVNEDGFREVLAMEVAGEEKGVAYASLLHGLLDRGLRGVRLVVSDDHEGTKAAVASELPGTEWQRCVVYFQRNVLAHVPAQAMEEVAEDLSAIFKVRRQKTALALAEEFVELHRKRFPKVISVFEVGISDALTYLSCPGPHEDPFDEHAGAPFKEVKRRTRVVGISQTRRVRLRWLPR